MELIPIQKISFTKGRPSGGRPTKFSDENVNKIVEVFKIGGTISEACEYVGISITTYNQWINKRPYLAEVFDQARIFPLIAAKNIVVKKMVEEGDVKLAQWYLDRTAFKDRKSGTDGSISMGGPSQVNIVFPEMVKEKYEEKQISKEPKKFRFDVSPSSENDI